MSSHSDLMRHLLFHRGITDEEQAKRFLNPDFDVDLHDPFLIFNMRRAVDRILLAISANEKIIIYGDYDCDGIPGSVILHDFFKKIKYDNFEVYIPHRHREGYGLNVHAVERFAQDGVRLLITVDNGIANVAEVDRANELGINVIITDHHLPQESVPKAFAILNSKQAEDSYPYDMLCGAGVAFKLVQALIQQWNKSEDSPSTLLGTACRTKIPAGWEKWLLDLAGISTIADMVPLTGENRVLAYYGLKVLRRTPRPGLLKLFRRAGVRLDSLSEEDVGFTIAPRINAASRMGEPIKGFEMLSATDEVDAGLRVDYLEEKNGERKKVVAKMMVEVDKIMAKDNGSAVIVVGHESWAPGVVGLAASKIVEKYDRPAFVWGQNEAGEIKGSCRSDGRVNLVDLMVTANVSGQDDNGGLFSAMGGHALAGGFSITRDKLERLGERLSATYAKLLKSLPCRQAGDPDIFERGSRQILVDKEITIDDVNEGIYKTVEKLAPFGVENHRPIFLISSLEIYRISFFGVGNSHLKLEFKNSHEDVIPAIAFYYGEKDFGSVQLKVGNKVDIIFTFESSTFGWKNELRMRIVGIK